LKAAKVTLGKKLLPRFFALPEIVAAKGKGNKNLRKDI
jgi:hypothetical protein